MKSNTFRVGTRRRGTPVMWGWRATGLGSTKEVMEGHDRQRITGMSDTWVKDRPRRLLRFVLIYFLLGADGTPP